MFINEYGDKNDPLVLLLAPMMVSGEELVIWPGYQHCAYMAAHPKEYVEEMESFIGRRKETTRHADI